jgi:hypothetical protein
MLTHQPLDDWDDALDVAQRQRLAGITKAIVNRV